MLSLESDKVDKLTESAEIISMFCRLNINAKRNLPIRSSEMGLLILTIKSEVPVTPVMAADFFKVKKPMITTMVISLCEKGYLEKVHSSEDKRSFTLHPTEKAMTLANEAHNEYFREIEIMRNGLGDKSFEKLITLLSKANDILLEAKEN